MFFRKTNLVVLFALAFFSVNSIAGTYLRIDHVETKFLFEVAQHHAQFGGVSREYQLGAGAVIHTESLAEGNLAIYILTNAHVWHGNGDFNIMQSFASRVDSENDDRDPIQVGQNFIRHFHTIRISFFEEGKQISKPFFAMPGASVNNSWLINRDGDGQRFGTLANELGAGIIGQCWQTDRRVQVTSSEAAKLGCDSLLFRIIVPETDFSQVRPYPVNVSFKGGPVAIPLPFVENDHGNYAAKIISDREFESTFLLSPVGDTFAVAHGWSGLPVLAKNNRGVEEMVGLVFGGWPGRNSLGLAQTMRNVSENGLGRATILNDIKWMRDNNYKPWKSGFYQ